VHKWTRTRYSLRWLYLTTAMNRPIRVLYGYFLSAPTEETNVVDVGLVGF
jgi:hypothetical protein